MELELGLSLSSHSFHSNKDDGLIGFKKDHGCFFDTKKRSFDEAFEIEKKSTNTKLKETITSLPLILWSDQPNDEDDDRDRKHNKSPSCPFNKNDAAEYDQVVGWPPIKSWRKKLLHGHQQQGGGRGGGRVILKSRAAAAACGGSGNETNKKNENYKYVKVKMEGVAITRKIDLRIFTSYQTLTKFLINMFAKCEKDRCSSTTNYTLTYQDKDGDWLLAGDVPWQSFMESVQRLELARNEL